LALSVADQLTIFQAIGSRFDSLVAKAETPDLITEYDNVKTEHPKDGIWARVNIRPSVTSQTEIGNPVTFRTLGVMIVQLFAPFDTGDRDLLVLADKIVTVFRRVTADGVTYRTPTVLSIGRNKEWWQVNVNCPFQADTIV
jgi:hypothetical protein